jgi:SH3-like domain-containing protein
MKAMDEGAANIIHAITPAANQGQVQTVKVKSKYQSVNVRSDPSTLKPPITSLSGGMEVLKISEKADWVQIRLDMEDGSQMDGWISKNVIE